MPPRSNSFHHGWKGGGLAIDMPTPASISRWGIRDPGIAARKPTACWRPWRVATAILRRLYRALQHGSMRDTGPGGVMKRFLEQRRQRFALAEGPRTGKRELHNRVCMS